MNKQLLVVIELGGYPNFIPLYKSLGYDVTMVTSVRNAIRSLKKIQPRAVVAEFNFQSDFRDRTSSLESLLSTIQTHDSCDVVVFYEVEHVHQLEKLTTQYPIHTLIPFPIEEEQLRQAMQNILETE
jgi:hypothetical protein